MKAKVYTRRGNTGEWSFYGECTEQELRREMENIRWLGLQVKVMRGRK